MSIMAQNCFRHARPLDGLMLSFAEASPRCDVFFQNRVKRPRGRTHLGGARRHYTARMFQPDQNEVAIPESQGELRLATILEAARIAGQLRSWQDQPPGFPTRLGNTESSFTPDAAFELHDGSKYAVSFKLLRDALRPEVVVRHSAAAESLPQRFDRLLLVTEAEIKRGYMLSNAKLLREIDDLSPGSLAMARAAVERMDRPMTILELARTLDLGTQGLRALYYLAATGAVEISEFTLDMAPETMLLPQTDETIPNLAIDIGKFLVHEDRVVTVEGISKGVVKLRDVVGVPRRTIVLREDQAQRLQRYETDDPNNLEMLDPEYAGKVYLHDADPEDRQRAVVRGLYLQAFFRLRKKKPGETRRNLQLEAIREVEPLVDRLTGLAGYHGPTKDKIMPPAPTTLDDWEANFRMGGYAALLPTKRSKDHEPREKRKDRLYRRAVIETLYRGLQVEPRVVRSALEELVAAYNENLPAGEEPIKKVGGKYLGRRLKEEPGYKVMRARYGAERAEQDYRATLQMERPDRPLEEVEMDCHVSNVQVRFTEELAKFVCITDGDEEIRPTLCAAIDRFSSACVACVPWRTKPNARLTRETLRRACSDQRPYHLATGKPLPSPLPPARWGSVYCDQGPKNLNAVLLATTMSLNIVQVFGPAAEPKLRPFVEHFFAIIILILIQLLPGQTGRSVADREGRHIDGRVRLTFEMFTSLLVEAVSIYNDRPNDGLGGLSPRTVFMEGVARHGLRAPVTGDVAARIFGKRHEGVIVGPHGVRVNGIGYQADDLQVLRREAGTAPALTVCDDPENVGRVQVRMPSGRFIWAVTPIEGLHGISLGEWQRFFRKWKRELDDRNGTTMVDTHRALERLRHRVETYRHQRGLGLARRCAEIVDSDPDEAEKYVPLPYIDGHYSSMSDEDRQVAHLLFDALTEKATKKTEAARAKIATTAQEARAARRVADEAEREAESARQEVPVANPERRGKGGGIDDDHLAGERDARNAADLTEDDGDDRELFDLR